MAQLLWRIPSAQLGEWSVARTLAVLSASVVFGLAIDCGPAKAQGTGHPPVINTTQWTLGAPVVESSDNNGTLGNSSSFHANFSPDGTLLVFYSSSTNLVSGATNGLTQVYVKNLLTGDVRLVSADAGGNEGDGTCFFPSNSTQVRMFSPDGTKVVFESSAANFGSGANGMQIFLKDLAGGGVTLVSANGSGIPGNNSSIDFSFSPDGTKVVFDSSASNLVPGASGQQIYIKDLVSQSVILVSTDVNGNAGDSSSLWPVFSPDGNEVAFVSSAGNLVAGGSFGQQIFVKNLITHEVTLVSADNSGKGGNNPSFFPMFSPDGGKVLFNSSSTNFASVPPTGFLETYVKDLTTKTITLVSSDVTGAAANNSIPIAAFSADGAMVGFYSTATNLVPTGTSNDQVFVKDLLTGAITLASTDAGGVQGNGLSTDANFSPDHTALGFDSNSSNFGVPPNGPFEIIMRPIFTPFGAVVDAPPATTLTTAGQLSFSDADPGDTHTASVATQNGDLGTLTATVSQDTTGTGTGGVVRWNYQVDETLVHALSTSAADTFILTLTDSQGCIATATIVVTDLLQNFGVVNAGGGGSPTSTTSTCQTTAATATTVMSSSNPSVFGQTVTFTAMVSAVAPAVGTPTGTVTFLDGGSPIGMGTLSGGIATFTTSALAVGGHTITASYGGDANFNASTGSLTGNPQVVNQANSSITVTSSQNPSGFGQSLVFTATVSAVAPGAGTPTGTVTFLDGGSPILTVPPFPLSGGVATFGASQVLAAGSHTITATYSGDGNFNASTSASITQTVLGPASIAEAFNPSMIVLNGTSALTFTITNPAPNGVDLIGVSFLDAFPFGLVPVASSTTTVCGGTLFIGPFNLSLSNATIPVNGQCQVSVTVTGVAVGTFTNFAGPVFSSNGGMGNQEATAALTVISASPTTTAVAASPTTITLGDTVTFTATVTTAIGTPTGLVTFFDGSTPLGSGTLTIVAGQSQANFSTSLLSAAASPHSVAAVYQGDATHTGSASPATSETVNPRSSTSAVVLAPNTVVVGQPSTATVTVTDSGSVPPGTADTFTPTGAPATGRTGFTSTLFADGLVLVAGGSDANNNVLSSAEIYSASGAAFTASGNLNTARTGAVAVLLPNGKVLIAGGSSDGTANGALNSAELFDPNAGTFTVTSQNMIVARFGATATLLNTGKVLLVGGVNSGGVLNSAELYDPVADTFTATGNLNTARTGASAALLGTGKILIAGGSSDGTANGALNSAEVFDPAGNAGAGTFASVAGTNPTLAAGRWQPEAALLLSGKVLIAGGQNSGGALASADLYDPVADAFTASNQSMAQARANGSAVALSSGMVLLVGGTTNQAVDLYDADSDQFDAAGSLQQSDNGLVATLLNNGQVLVVGLSTSATPASDAEQYSPSFNPLGTVGLSSSEATDSFGSACVLTPSTSTASTCSSSVTPVNVATSPHTITETYPADAVHSGSSNTASLTVNSRDTTTAITSSANPSVFGQSVTFTATVSTVTPGAGTPTGTVTFLDGGSPIGTGTLSGGIATFTTSTLAVGSHTITTSYGGDASFNGSTGALTGNPQVVSKAASSTTVNSSANPSILNQSVTFTATVSVVAPGAGSPSGTITFSDGTTTLANVPLVSGTATFSTSALAVNSHSITAAYSGDGNFNGSSSSLTQTVSYSIVVLYDQDRAVHGGATFPIKVALYDANGVDVSSSTIVLNAKAVTMASGFSGTPDSPGNANPDSDFRFDGTLGATGRYIFNLSTGGLAPGTYSLQFAAGADPVLHTVMFGVAP